jgi:F-type H+-transporting ATPase subunit gamma
MAQNMRDIKRRIKSVQNTKQITKAMEMVSAAKLRRAQERAQSSRPYADKMREVISSIAAGSKGINHPMMVTREVKKTGYLVISSDRGLAGGYNGNLLRKLAQTIRARHKSDNEYVIFVIGRKGRDFLKKRNYPVAGEVTGLPDSPEFMDIKEVTSKAVQMFADGSYDELYIYYNEFISAIAQIPTEKRLLPLENQEGGAEVSNYEYEPSPEGVLEALLPKYAETLIFSALLESKASEHGARMTAMGNATKNATEMIASLTLSFNRARQASITQEISEIVAGANAQ